VPSPPPLKYMHTSLRSCPTTPGCKVQRLPHGQLPNVLQSEELEKLNDLPRYTRNPAVGTGSQDREDDEPCPNSPCHAGPHTSLSSGERTLKTDVRCRSPLLQPAVSKGLTQLMSLHTMCFCHELPRRCCHAKYCTRWESTGMGPTLRHPSHRCTIQPRMRRTQPARATLSQPSPQISPTKTKSDTSNLELGGRGHRCHNSDEVP